MINTYDYIGICIGVLGAIILILERATNKPDLSYFQVIKANIQEKRGWKIVFFLLICFVSQFIIAYLLLCILLSNQTIMKFNEATRHLPLPFIAALVPSLFYKRIATIVTKSLINPNSFGDITKLIQLITESTVKFWDSCIRIASTFYTAKILEDENSAPFITMYYEKKKIVISLIEKEPYLLRTRNLSKKTHLLMNHFGYENFKHQIRDEDLKSKILDDFKCDGIDWDGLERRQEKRLTTRRRIGDFKHITSTILEGLP